MCLLDEVVTWSADRISCRSKSHRAVDNPLRSHGRLGIACGIEYAAQTMAVHGALAAGALDPAAVGAAPAAGFLVGVRGVHFHAVRLDDVAGDLICDVSRVAGDGGMAVYEFELRSQTVRLLHGRASVVLDAGVRMFT